MCIDTLCFQSRYAWQSLPLPSVWRVLIVIHAVRMEVWVSNGCQCTEAVTSTVIFSYILLGVAAFRGTLNFASEEYPRVPSPPYRLSSDTSLATQFKARQRQICKGVKHCYTTFVAYYLPPRLSRSLFLSAYLSMFWPIRNPKTLTFTFKGEITLTQLQASPSNFQRQDTSGRCFAALKK